MKKNVWLFHSYATPPTMSGLVRPYEFSKQLKIKGYKSTVFASAFLHYTGENLIEDNKKYLEHLDSGVRFIFVRSSEYKDNGLFRVLNMLSFAYNLNSVAKALLQKGEKPDVIYASSPHPLTMVAGIKIAHKLKIPCICEVRDLWPDVIFSVGKVKKESILGKILLAGEHWIYKKADALVFLKEGDIGYLKEKKWALEQGGEIDLNNCFYINNGVDSEEFIKNIAENHFADEDLDDGSFKVVYTGAIRTLNNVEFLLDAAKFLKKIQNIKFLIYGTGDQIDLLKQKIITEGLTNVKMKGYVARKYMPYILSKASVNILNYSQSLYNWTRGNSSNKLFEYMASGKPIISTVKMGYCLLEKYQCGISLEKSAPEELARAILEVYDMPQKRYDQMCQNAQAGAKNFDYKILTAKLIEVLENV
jgi:glycosyltransferase involved in cell wall biosynthesis